jgi:high potential iron-sulfur protein
MNKSSHWSRRELLQRLALGLSLAPLARSAEMPLLRELAPEAKAVQYVEDASRATAVQSGADCSSCSLYSAASGAAQGTCTLFPGKLVKAAGWCNKWSGL